MMSGTALVSDLRGGRGGARPGNGSWSPCGGWVCVMCECVQVGCRGGGCWGVPVAESAVAPPGSIPNPVVTHGSAGEYCRGDAVGGEAAAGAPQDPLFTTPPPTQAPRAGAGWSSGSSLGS